MKIVEDGEALEIEGVLFREGEEDEFMVPSSLIANKYLSDIPQGYGVIPCGIIIGSNDLYRNGSCSKIEHAKSGEFLAYCEFAFIFDEDNANPGAVALEVKRQGENAKKILLNEPFIGRVVGLELNCYEDIAYLCFSLSLANQSIADAELFMTSIEDRVNSESNRHTLFLCHASEDKVFVDRLDRSLQGDAQMAWYDRREIFVGDSIVYEINSGLGEARFLVAVLSKKSVNKPWVLRELNSTLMRNLGGEEIRILPVLIEDCEIPPLLNDYKFADFRSSFDDGYSELLDAIRKT